jgi:D-beta-D-heptose 7-phosphate kinase/D-beta-D-heptose 1-phosphate adenosyltransferase
MSDVLEPAPITDFATLNELRPRLGRVVAVSGGFDPVHPGHASMLLEAKKLGDTVVAIVNGDAFLRRKKGRPFQDLRTRCQVVSFLRGVDYVLPFEIEGDMTVCEALRRLRPNVFANGGDRASTRDIPEEKVCAEHGIEMVFGVGASKQWSSSNFLKDWSDFVLAGARNGTSKGPG